MHMGGVKVLFNSILTRAQDGGEWSASQTGCFTHWKQPLYPMKWHWVSPIGGLHILEKRKPLVPVAIQTPNHQTCSLVTILTILFWHPHHYQRTAYSLVHDNLTFCEKCCAKHVHNYSPKNIVKLGNVGILNLSRKAWHLLNYTVYKSVLCYLRSLLAVHIWTWGLTCGLSVNFIWDFH